MKRIIKGTLIGVVTICVTLAAFLGVCLLLMPEEYADMV